ncbi:MAG: hydroxymethylbilane synthase [Phycisphaerales bacterium]|nr:MAG: hydroxymethylbilane synthase [Phycisphaerales bacterium]
MTQLRVGTRGSDLALWQTRWVCDRLREAHPGLQIDETIIKTHGDTAKDQLFSADWPVGGFVKALEDALIEERVDFAVHSYKDLQTAVTAGLIVAAVPKRVAVQDVLLTRSRFDLDNVPANFKIATSSPRRSAQLRRLGVIEIVPIRGNLPTRVAKLQRENLDGVVLAAAGLTRLGIEHPYVTDLPTDRFVPSPAQGALAIQTRANTEAAEVVAAINHEESRRRVEAERSFLATIEAGCHVPVGALAEVDGPNVSLHAQLFSEDGVHLVEGVETGPDPVEIGRKLAERLKSELEEVS